MLVKTQCPWCVHAQKISAYCYGCYQKECHYEYGEVDALYPCSNIHKNSQEEHSELGTEIIETLQEATDEKNHALLKELILDNTNNFDIVFDCCMGSGSTGIVAKQLNRNFVGIELDEKFFKLAEKRINNTTYQISFF